MSLLVDRLMDKSDDVFMTVVEYVTRYEPQLLEQGFDIEAVLLDVQEEAVVYAGSLGTVRKAVPAPDELVEKGVPTLFSFPKYIWFGTDFMR